MTIAPGENVGPYRVIEQLGSGGMATVFKAYHASLDRYVAIKVLHPAFKADPQFFERFKREAKIVANLEHPNIIPVYDFNEHLGEPYLVMRFIEGDTLKPRMEGQPMAPKEILDLMRPVCQALDYAHNQGVLHRDIKPSNIMLTREGSIFITDFGLARMVQAGESTLSQDMMVGTPQYISPEQAQGMSDLDGRTDIYSLGVVLYEMATGQVPFNADTPFATVHDHIYAALPVPSTVNPDIDPAIERLLLKALAKEPDDRFKTAADLLTALESTVGAHLAATSTVREAPPAAGSKAGSLPWWALAGSAALALCFLGLLLAGFLLFQSRNGNGPLPDKEPVSAPVANNGQTVDEGTSTQPAPAGDRVETAPTPLPPPPSDEQSDSPPPPPNADNGGPGGQQAPELTQQGNQALRQGDPAEAAALFEEAIAANPQHLPAYYGLSEALKQLGNDEGSVAALLAAAENNPESAGAYMRLGEALLENNPEEALFAFEEASALEPEAPVPYAGQAIALLALDQDDVAKEAIDTALGLDQGNPEAHLASAIYNIKQGNRRVALQELQQLVQNRRTSDRIRDRALDLLKNISR